MVQNKKIINSKKIENYTSFLGWMWQLSEIEHLTYFVANTCWVLTLSQRLGIKIWTKAVTAPAPKMLQSNDDQLFYYLLPNTRPSSWPQYFSYWSQSLKLESLVVFWLMPLAGPHVRIYVASLLHRHFLSGSLPLPWISSHFSRSGPTASSWLEW